MSLVGNLNDRGLQAEANQFLTSPRVARAKPHTSECFSPAFRISEMAFAVFSRNLGEAGLDAPDPRAHPTSWQSPTSAAD